MTIDQDDMVVAFLDFLLKSMLPLDLPTVKHCRVHYTPLFSFLGSCTSFHWNAYVDGFLLVTVMGIL